MSSPNRGGALFTRDGEPSEIQNYPINNTRTLRTSHRNVANNRAEKLNWYRGGAPEDGHRTVDDFIAEAVNRVIDELKK